MDASLEKATMRRVSWRLVPFICLLYFIAFIDRVNIGFAALTMNKDLGFSASVFGFGAGIFFLGYFLFEVPSNIILEKVGARLWIARVMITWGLVSGAMAFVQVKCFTHHEDAIIALNHLGSAYVLSDGDDQTIAVWDQSLVLCEDAAEMPSPARRACARGPRRRQPGRVPR